MCNSALPLIRQCSFCERCHEEADSLVVVETMKVTFWSPAETASWCISCVRQVQAQAEQIDAQRDEAADRRRDARLGF